MNSAVWNQGLAKRVRADLHRIRNERKHLFSVLSTELKATLAVLNRLDCRRN